MGLSKQRRLRRRDEFRRVLRDGKRARDALLAITAAESGDLKSDSRYGFAIPKRVGGAVTRNRVKRRLRAIARTTDHPEGWDIVIYAFPAAAEATSELLSASVKRLLRRLIHDSREPRDGKRTWRTSR